MGSVPPRVSLTRDDFSLNFAKNPKPRNSLTSPSLQGNNLNSFKMENAYGIGVANRYAFLMDEDADPMEILKQSEQANLEAKAKKTEEANKPKTAKEVKKDDPKINESDKENQRTNPKDNQRNNASGGRFDGKRVVDARRAEGGQREERNNLRNQEGGPPRREGDGEMGQ